MASQIRIHTGQRAGWAHHKQILANLHHVDTAMHGVRPAGVAALRDQHRLSLAKTTTSSKHGSQDGHWSTENDTRKFT